MRVKGRVQGVGFRALACRLAEKESLFGTVRNCADGSVEIVAQGNEVDLDAFVTRLREMKNPISIERINIEKRAPTARFKEFTTLF